MKLIKVKIGDAEVANQAGKYKNFTGKIDFKSAKGEAKNADFELRDNGDIKWSKGSFKGGWMKKAVWENGTWIDGTWIDGLWVNGTWMKGNFDWGTWLNGTWKKGNIKGKPSTTAPTK